MGFINQLITGGHHPVSPPRIFFGHCCMLELCDMLVIMDIMVAGHEDTEQSTQFLPGRFTALTDFFVQVH